ncbi:MAG: hypothetical protein KJ804_09310 [Proteobacteria bacterium]|nr:hypothetical protein [Pseudomonadota bacterium]MBU1058497.1 hypothetical protein [Pseudomonadota bacterium]
MLRTAYSKIWQGGNRILLPTYLPIPDIPLRFLLQPLQGFQPLDREDDGQGTATPSATVPKVPMATLPTLFCLT